MNNHFSNIRINQIKTMYELNELSSFAGHISEKFQNDILTVYNNTQNSKQAMTNISDYLEFIVQIQDHSLQISIIESYLTKLLNTITLASSNILDIGLFDLNQLRDIWNFLKAHYFHNQLWPLDQIYELVSICKVGFVQINDNKAILVVKIPIFRQSSCQLNIVYPVPTDKQIVLIPPSKYYCSEQWYHNCKVVNNKWFCINQLTGSCKLKNCNYTLVNNTYNIALFTQNNKFLYCNKEPIEIIENCEPISKQTVNNCNIISSSCDIIIGTEMFSNLNFHLTEKPENISFTISANVGINLKLQHLQTPGNDERHIQTCY
ncbi:hypothetical protein HHI36_018056 [Cryptolaemus montrouzieri]|uniref:Envelope protein n=1 Tax=Cryptolaemus montrouzieri TaxID=559131 RepID=A0ABD2NZQ8_9CUCU